MQSYIGMQLPTRSHLYIIIIIRELNPEYDNVDEYLILKYSQDHIAVNFLLQIR